MKKQTIGLLGQIVRVSANAKFEIGLACLLLLTAAAVIWQDRILDRTIRLTPQSTASSARRIFSDADTGGHTTIRETAPLIWNCDLRPGAPYPYCGDELFFDGHMGVHGLNLTNMRSLTVVMFYRGPSTSFRVHLKNYDARYSHSTNDDSPKYMRVEADTTPGRMQHIEFTPADFGVADWWLRKSKLAPEFGHPQFDNVTSMNVETGSEAPSGHHEFSIREIVMRTTVLSEAQWYSLLLGIWIVMIVLYLGYRVGNLRRARQQRRALDVMALHDAQEAARRDPLTRILNRRGLYDGFAEALEKRAGPVSMTLVLIDIDRFKKLNDTFGHDCGDRVLTATADLLSRNVRTVDFVARWGGEEFVVACLGVDQRGAQVLAEKIRASIEQFDFGECGKVTASLGVHWAPVAEAELSKFVALADVALYDAKAGGRNCCRFNGIEIPNAA